MRAPLVAAALLAAFGAWLALPRPVVADERRELCLVDVSASVRRTRPDWGAWAGAELEKFARDAEARGARTWVVAVARGHRQLAPREDARRLVDRLRAGELVDLVPVGLDPLGTDIDGAFASCEEWLAGASGGRVVWLGDGEVDDDPDALGERLARLAAHGVAVELREPPPPQRADARIVRLDAARLLESGAPLAVNVEIACPIPAATPGTLAVELIEPGGAGRVVQSFEQSIDLAVRGSRRATFAFDPPAPGVYIVRAEVKLAVDAARENDRLESVLRVGGELVCQVVARDLELGAAEVFARAFERALPGTSFTVAPLDGLAGLIGLTDVVIAFDVPPSDLPVALLEPFVRAGGGLFALGGVSQHVRSSSGPGVELLPLVCAPPGIEPRDVVLLLDGSGSMAGAPFDAVRVAARDILLATPPGDGLEVAVFTDGLAGSALDVRAGEEFDERAQQSAERWLARLEAPGGRTSIVRSLEQWLRERRERLARDGERRAAVVLLTDGREDMDTPNVEQRLAAIRAELDALHAVAYSVAIGDPIDREFLAELVPEVQRRLEPAPDELRRAVSDVAASERLLDGPLRVRATRLGVELGFPALLQLVERASRARVRSAAETLLESTDGEPLLAIWSVGLGRVASAAIGATWSVDLREQPQRFGGLVRHLARRDVPATAWLERDDRGLRLRGAATNEPRLVGVLEIEGRGPRTIALEAGPEGWRAGIAELTDLESSPAGAWLTIAELGRFPVPARPPRELSGGGTRLVIGAAERSAVASGSAGHPAAAWVLLLAGVAATTAVLPLPGVARRTVKPDRGSLR